MAKCCRYYRLSARYVLGCGECEGGHRGQGDDASGDLHHGAPGQDRQRPGAPHAPARAHGRLQRAQADAAPEAVAQP